MEREHATSCLDKFKSAFVEQKLKKHYLPFKTFPYEQTPLNFPIGSHQYQSEKV